MPSKARRCAASPDRARCGGRLGHGGGKERRASTACASSFIRYPGSGAGCPIKPSCLFNQAAAAACVYCTYGAVSPSKFSAASRLNTISLMRLFLSAAKTTAPTPTCRATVSASGRLGFLSAMMARAFSIASSNISSSQTTRPFRVDIAPSGRLTMP